MVEGSKTMTAALGPPAEGAYGSLSAKSAN